MAWRTFSQGSSWWNPPVVHADLASMAALAAAHQDRAAPRVEIELGQVERFLDAQAGAPEHDDQPAGTQPVQAVATAAHDGDDLFGTGRVGGVAAALATRRPSGQEAGHGRRRAATTQRVQRC
jgi:hypothetical protein